MMGCIVGSQESFAGIRALRISINGLQVGHDAAEVAFAYAPELKVGSAPPIQISSWKYQTRTMPSHLDKPLLKQIFP